MTDLSMRATCTAILGACLAVSTLRFGATQEHVLYGAFLVLAPLTLFVLFRLADPADPAPAEAAALWAVGAALLTAATLQPTARAFGYLIVAVGWMVLLQARQLAGHEAIRHALWALLVALGVLEAGVGLLQGVAGVDRIGLYERGLGDIASGTFINRNHYAAHLNMCFSMMLGALYLQFGARRRRRTARSELYAWTWVMAIGLSSVGVASLLSRSRGGAVSLLGTLVVLFALLSLRRRRQPTPMPPAFALVLILLTVLLTATLGVDALAGRWFADSEVRRPQIYADTLRMIADSPWLGVGAGMYAWRFRAYQTIQPEAHYDHAHNDYLQSAAEWGVPAASVFWGFLFVVLVRVARTFLRAEDHARAALSLGVAGAIVSISLHSLVDFSLQIPANLMTLGLVLGLGLALVREETAA